MPHRRPRRLPEASVAAELLRLPVRRSAEAAESVGPDDGAAAGACRSGAEAGACPPAEGVTRVASGPSLKIRVSTTRGGNTIAYSTTGTYRSLTVNNVANPDLVTGTLTGTGSKAFWEAVLNAVLADITAGHGGGS